MGMLIDSPRHKWCKIAVSGWKRRLEALQGVVDDAAAMMEREAQQAMAQAERESLRGEYVRDKYYSGLAHGWRQASQMLQRNAKPLA